MATEEEIAEINKFQKEIGGTPIKPGKPAAPTPSAPGIGPPSAEAAPATPAAPSKELTEEQLRKLRPPEWQTQGLRGIGKGLTRTATNVAELAGRLPVSPLGALLGYSKTLGDLAEKYAPEAAKRKFREAEEFGARPSESTAEWIGSGLGEALPMAALPEIGAERALGALGARVFPTVFSRATGFGPSLGGRFMTGMGRTLDDVTKGAAAGAVANPDEPGYGAATGAVGGLIPGVGRGAQTRYGQWVAGRALPTSLASAVGGLGSYIATQFGIPPAYASAIALEAIRESIRWHHSPLGQALEKAGRAGAMKGGAALRRVPAGVVGTGAGEAVRGGEDIVSDYMNQEPAQ